MAERVVLHVGLMKSGTSFIQQVLSHNRQALRDHDVLFPSPWRLQVQAVRDVIAHGDGGQQPPLADDGPWRRLVAEVQGWPGTVALSMEFLGPRGPAKAQQILADFAPAHVEVVISARDLARTIPAMWQEQVQNRGTRTWDEYLAGVRDEDRENPGPGRSFWFRQDVPRITEVWQGAAGRDNVVLLTVPPPGTPPSVLWDRFASVLGVDSTNLDLEVPSNPSLGLAALLVLRQLNVRLQARERALGPDRYERVVKQLLAKRGLAGRPGDTRLGYRADWVAARGDQDVERLRELGVRVVGDLEDLRCHPVEGREPDEVDAGQQLEAALDGLEFVVDQLSRRDQPGRQARSES